MVTSIFSPISGKLTKAFLIAAPAGGYLASNCGFPPIFAEVIAPTLPGRLVQWKRIVRVRANGRLCYIYGSKGACDRMYKALREQTLTPREIGKMQ